MALINIKIDWIDSNYAASVEDESIACVATGKTLSEVKQNIAEALDFHLKGMQDDGEFISKKFIGEKKYNYTMTARAMLKQCDQFITRKALAKVTGISEQQLSHYANGYRNARPAMTKRIATGIHNICDQLAMIF